MILWEKSDCSPDWTELLSILADLAKLTEKCSKNCGLLPKLKLYGARAMAVMSPYDILRSPYDSRTMLGVRTDTARSP